MLVNARDVLRSNLRASSGYWSGLLGAVALLIPSLLLLLTTQAQGKPQRRVLILYESNPNSPLVKLVDDGIDAALNNSSYQIEFYREYFETASFPDPADQQEFREFYVHKYRNRQPDVIIAVGPSPLRFMVEKHKQAFPGAPVVFCLPNRIPLEGTIDPDFTGVQGDIAPAKTLDVGLHLLPDTKHVVVVVGTTPFDKQQLAAIRNELMPYESRIDISYFTDFLMPDILDRLGHLPPNSIVLLGAFGRDAAGNVYTSDQSGPMFVSAAKVPVFSLNDRHLNHGEVGGDVANAVEQGKIAGGMALRLFNGEKPKDIAPVKDEATYEFDWRALKRWGLQETALPPGSIVLNRPPTFWEQNRKYAVATIFVLLAQTAAIVALLWHRARRRKAEQKVRESQEQLSGIVRSAMDAMITVDEQQRIVLFNAAAEEMFGCPQNEAIGSGLDRFIPQFFLQHHEEYLRRFGESAVTARSMGALGSLWAVRRSGQEFPIEASISQAESGGKKLFTAIIRDITERRRTEEAIRESEERFRLVANTAPVMIWMAGPDNLCTYVNQTWLDFTGRSLQEELGEGWLAGLHPEDKQACLEGCNRASGQRKPHEMEYRLRRRDGEYRWILDSSVPRFDVDGSFAGYIGSGIDVTARKQAKDALASVSRKLIEVQEQERRRIARDLHDDISQRLALLVFDVGELQEDYSGSADDRNRRLAEINLQIEEISTGVQSISRQLHSPQLEYLGLVVAMQSFCRDFSKRQGMEVDFFHDQIPNPAPYEISLCLFRILQEALHNAAKHSKVRHVEVRLDTSSNQLCLTIADRGAGFDYQAAMLKGGLGLLSMQERVRMVNGTMEIQSEPMAGTIVKVHVPFTSSNASERVAS